MLHPNLARTQRLAEACSAGRSLRSRAGLMAASSEDAPVDKQKVRTRIEEIGIVPVVRASSSREACIAAEAVCKGGIPIVEITMTVPGAIEVIRELAKSCGAEVLIGAGTVLNAEDARRCLDAGGQFLVTPGFNLATVEFAARESKLIMAEGLTPT